MKTVKQPSKTRKLKSAPMLLAAPINYTYYIAYQYAGGFGCSVRVLAIPLNTWNQIQTTAKLIAAENKLKNVIITNWILL